MHYIQIWFLIFIFLYIIISKYWNVYNILLCFQTTHTIVWIRTLLQFFNLIIKWAITKHLDNLIKNIWFCSLTPYNNNIYYYIVHTSYFYGAITTTHTFVELRHRSHTWFDLETSITILSLLKFQYKNTIVK